MTVWDYTIYVTQPMGSAIFGPEPTELWTRKYNDGKTDLDKLKEMGNAGWELVSAFPMGSGGKNDKIVFTFKKPKSQSS